MLNITHDQRNANQNHNKVPSQCEPPSDPLCNPFLLSAGGTYNLSMAKMMGCHSCDYVLLNKTLPL